MSQREILSACTKSYLRDLPSIDALKKIVRDFDFTIRNRDIRGFISLWTSSVAFPASGHEWLPSGI
jgi:hypothetical protein